MIIIINSLADGIFIIKFPETAEVEMTGKVVYFTVTYKVISAFTAIRTSLVVPQEYSSRRAQKTIWRIIYVGLIQIDTSFCCCKYENVWLYRVDCLLLNVSEAHPSSI